MSSATERKIEKKVGLGFLIFGITFILIGIIHFMKKLAILSLSILNEDTTEFGFYFGLLILAAGLTLIINAIRR